MLSVTRDGLGLTLTWTSVTNRNCSLERATRLEIPSTFSTVANGIAGELENTAFTDTTASGSGRYYYRVSTQP